MADRELLRLVKSEGRQAWTEWRARHRHVRPNLRHATLRGHDLRHWNLRDADLEDARLTGANLKDALLDRANLAGADLSGCELSDAQLNQVNLHGARLVGATATMTYFFGANFTKADLSGADCCDSWFVDALFMHTDLTDARFDGANFGETVFGGVDLARARGLAEASHHGPSVMDHRTLSTAADIPEPFLRGCGLPEILMTQLGALFGATRYESCFLSYATEDERFAVKLERSLTQRGIRSWFAPTSMRAGAELTTTLQAQVRQQGRLVVILSEHSLRSDWVSQEVGAARASEAERGQKLIVPITIDDAVMRSDAPLAIDMRKRSIADFTRWQNRRAYPRALDGLVRSLTMVSGETP